MEKASDRVDWEFNLAIPKKFGIYDKVTDGIRECVETVTFLMLLNNGLTDIFLPKRGLRQGDPIAYIHKWNWVPLD